MYNQNNLAVCEKRKAGSGITLELLCCPFVISGSNTRPNRKIRLENEVTEVNQVTGFIASQTVDPTPEKYV